MEPMMEQYHYTDCGLDYIYLLNGFDEMETPYGRGSAIENVDGLHAAIALDIIMSPHAIRGQEVRFLRAMLNVSQAGLGDIVGKSRATVARWEGSPRDPIPGEADRLIRLFYALKMAGHKVADRIVELLTQIDELEHSMALFEDTDEGWVARAA